MNRMLSTLATLALLTAFAGPAAAQQVAVSLAGKDARTISAEIDKAAWSACSQAYIKGEIEFQEVYACAKDASANAKEQAYEILAAAHEPDIGLLARNDLRSRRR